MEDALQKLFKKASNEDTKPKLEPGKSNVLNTSSLFSQKKSTSPAQPVTPKLPQAEEVKKLVQKPQELKPTEEPQVQSEAVETKQVNERYEGIEDLESLIVNAEALAERVRRGEIVRHTTAVIDYLPKEYEGLNTKIRQIARPDLPIEYYRHGPKKSHFDLYNRNLAKRLESQNFSQVNAYTNGGVSLTKSQVIEACLDFVFYDMELRPEGFKSTEDLRNHLRSKLK